jgi:hypothetical protein
MSSVSVLASQTTAGTPLKTGWPMAPRKPGEPDRRIDPDAELVKQFGVGCVVLLLAFLLLTALVWWFWMH